MITKLQVLKHTRFIFTVGIKTSVYTYEVNNEIKGVFFGSTGRNSYVLLERHFRAPHSVLATSLAHH